MIWDYDKKGVGLSRKEGDGKKSAMEEDDRRCVFGLCEIRSRGEGTAGEEVYDAAAWRRM